MRHTVVVPTTTKVRCTPSSSRGCRSGSSSARPYDQSGLADDVLATRTAAVNLRQQQANGRGAYRPLINAKRCQRRRDQRCQQDIVGASHGDILRNATAQFLAGQERASPRPGVVAEQSIGRGTGCQVTAPRPCGHLHRWANKRSAGPGRAGGRPPPGPRRSPGAAPCPLYDLAGPARKPMTRIQTSTRWRTADIVPVASSTRTERRLLPGSCRLRSTTARWRARSAARGPGLMRGLHLRRPSTPFLPASPAPRPRAPGPPRR